MRIALFGGSFDPPHIGHQMACLYVLETHDIDELWLVPCFQHPFDKRMTEFAHRVAMCRRVAGSLSPRVQVCTIEEELRGPSYTISTVRALSARHPGHQFHVVIGADLLAERPRWHGYAELVERVRFIVLGRTPDAGGPSHAHKSAGRTAVHRPGHEPRVAAAPVTPPPLAHDIRHPQPLDLPAVSSTGVRAELAAGRAPDGWVPRSVLSYIHEHALYVEPSPAATRPSDAENRNDSARMPEGNDAIRR